MTDETKHSPEPWRFEFHPDPGYGAVVDADGKVIAFLPGLVTPDEAWHRIVACVNACAGIPTAALEAGHLAKALDGMLSVWCEECGWRVGDSSATNARCPHCSRVRASLRPLGRIKP